MSEPDSERATYEGVLAAPEHQVAEVLAGELYTHPRPRSPVTRVTSLLGGKLVNPFDLGVGGPGNWFLLDEPEAHLGDDILVPDLAGWRRESMPELLDVAYFTRAPDWVCEVLSPSTALRDRSLKMKIYARERVAHVWLIDPRARTLEVFRHDGDGYHLVDVFGEDQVVRAEPFAAVGIELGHLWLGHAKG